MIKATVCQCNGSYVTPGPQLEQRANCMNTELVLNLPFGGHY